MSATRSKVFSRMFLTMPWAFGIMEVMAFFGSIARHSIARPPYEVFGAICPLTTAVVRCLIKCDGNVWKRFSRNVVDKAVRVRYNRSDGLFRSGCAQLNRAASAY